MEYRAGADTGLQQGRVCSMGKRNKKKAARLREEQRRKNKKILVRYIWISLFCFVFYLIYNHFSHEVHSPWMTWLFAWPFCLGAVPSALIYSGAFSALARKPSGFGAGKISGDSEGALSGVFPEDVYRYGIAALTSASLLKGILQIAGTDSKYASFLLAAGVVMTCAGAAGYIVSYLKRGGQSPV